MRRVRRWYYYEHVNGTFHRKPAFVVEAAGGPEHYFDSPFVKRWWTEEEPDDGPANEGERDE